MELYAKYPCPAVWIKGRQMNSRILQDPVLALVYSNFIKKVRLGGWGLRGRRPRHQASTLECVHHHSVRKWKYILRFEKYVLGFEIGPNINCRTTILCDLSYPSNDVNIYQVVLLQLSLSYHSNEVNIYRIVQLQNLLNKIPYSNIQQLLFVGKH